MSPSCCQGSKELGPPCAACSREVLGAPGQLCHGSATSAAQSSQKSECDWDWEGPESSFHRTPCPRTPSTVSGCSELCPSRDGKQGAAAATEPWELPGQLRWVCNHFPLLPTAASGCCCPKSQPWVDIPPSGAPVLAVAHGGFVWGKNSLPCTPTLLWDPK